MAEVVRGSCRITVGGLWHVNQVGSFGKTKSHVGVYMSVGEKKKINNSIFLLPSCQQEVFNLIKELKKRKATRTLDIETKFIKLANPIISFVLSELFNLCLRTGTYPDLMEVGEVIPIFKKGKKTN